MELVEVDPLQDSALERPEPVAVVDAGFPARYRRHHVTAKRETISLIVISCIARIILVTDVLS